MIEFYFTPELHLKDGRVIRDLNDAASFAREQETGQVSTGAMKYCTAWSAPRAGKNHAAAHPFIRWLEELGIVE
jgi:hypothetical protein